MQIDYASIIDGLIDPVRAAGAAIMEVHARGVVAETKSDGSPVTEADQAAEDILLAALASVASEIPVVSEENAASHKLAAADQFFLVDPLDGTKEFLRADGRGAFTVNIGLVEHGIPTMGIVFAPALDRLFWGAPGTGAVEVASGASNAITVRDLPPTGSLAVASRSHRDEQTNAWLAQYGIEETIATGSSLKFCLVAAGEADVYPRFGPTMEWDTSAGDAILRAAGGTVVNPDGTLFPYGKADYRNGAFIACGKFAL